LIDLARVASIVELFVLVNTLSRKRVPSFQLRAGLLVALSYTTSKPVPSKVEGTGGLPNVYYRIGCPKIIIGEGMSSYLSWYIFKVETQNFAPLQNCCTDSAGNLKPYE